MTDLETLADTVRNARKQNGWGQQELAQRAQVSLGVVSNLERAKTKPQPGNLRAIMGALGLDGFDEHADEDDTRHWPRDIAVVLDVMGLYLNSIPEERRAEQIHAITRYVFNLAREQGAG